MSLEASLKRETSSVNHIRDFSMPITNLNVVSLFILLMVMILLSMREWIFLASKFVIKVECARYRWHFYLKWTRKLENKGRSLSHSLHRIARNALLFIFLEPGHLSLIASWHTQYAYAYTRISCSNNTLQYLRSSILRGGMFSLYFVFHVYHRTIDPFMWPCTCKSLDPNDKNPLTFEMSFIIH